MTFYFWIDDERPIPENIIRYSIDNKVSMVQCVTFDEAVSYFTKFVTSDDDYIIDFDHDLGEGKSGYDFAKWLLENEVRPESFHVHSMNPVGAKNIYQLLTHYGWHYIV